MDAFPAFIPLAGARVVVAGTGAAADAKARLFDGSPAVLTRLPALEALDADACAGARIVFLAGEDLPALAAAAARARAAGALVNVVDTPALSDFATPSIVDRGAVVGAVGTGGAAPVLAVRLRQDLEARWPRRLGDLARLLERMRPAARARLDGMDARRRYFARLLDGEAAALALAGETDRATAAAKVLLAGERAPAGVAVLIALPAEPDLLTLRAVRALGAADRIFADGDAPPEVLAASRRDAPRAAVDRDAIALATRAGDRVAVVCAAPQPLARALADRGVPVEHIG